MKVNLNIHSGIYHVSSIITGFHMLSLNGDISLKINDLRSDSKSLNNEALIDAEVDGKKVVFDLMDGYQYNNKNAVDEYFAEADIIFKRSYSKRQNSVFSKEIAEKIYPLGFNYYVTYKNNPLIESPKFPNNILNNIKLTKSYVNDFEAPVLKPCKNPKILFLARLWNPDDDDIKNSPELKEERIIINKMRTDTIKALKKEFKNNFFGGIYIDDFSLNYCPDILVPKKISLKRAYLNRMKHSDICVNTMGLHGSIGWKTGEYVAASRAIVSEKFLYDVTGDFSDGKNYLSFSTPEQCVEKVTELFEDSEKRVQMSERNKIYYEKYLRPDAQVKQALEILKARLK